MQHARQTQQMTSLVNEVKWNNTIRINQIEMIRGIIIKTKVRLTDKKEVMITHWVVKQKLWTVVVITIICTLCHAAPMKSIWLPHTLPGQMHYLTFDIAFRTATRLNVDTVCRMYWVRYMSCTMPFLHYTLMSLHVWCLHSIMCFTTMIWRW